MLSDDDGESDKQEATVSSLTLPNSMDKSHHNYMYSQG